MSCVEQRRPAVLAIDDDPNILDIIKTHLESEGFAVVVHDEPQQALQWYAAHWAAVDVVLLDYKMPGLNGEAVFDGLRRINPGTRVVLLTACDAAVATGLFEKGLCGYLQKPFYLSQLTQVVRAAMEANR
ncbi:MAG: response regulator [Verrucomicrobiae bacterium]|nr:response regulator [Verrucomicrobiae bacterium]